MGFRRSILSKEMGKRLVKKVVYFYDQGSDVEMTSDSDEDESYHSSQD